VINQERSALVFSNNRLLKFLFLEIFNKLEHIYVYPRFFVPPEVVMQTFVFKIGTPFFLSIGEQIMI